MAPPLVSYTMRRLPPLPPRTRGSFTARFVGQGEAALNRWFDRSTAMPVLSNGRLSGDLAALQLPYCRQYRDGPTLQKRSQFVRWESRSAAYSSSLYRCLNRELCRRHSNRCARSETVGVSDSISSIAAIATRHDGSSSAKVELCIHPNSCT